MDLFHRLLEEFAILRPIDGVQLRPDEFDVPFIEKAALCELATQRKSRLAAQRSEK